LKLLKYNSLGKIVRGMVIISLECLNEVINIQKRGKSTKTTNMKKKKSMMISIISILAL